MREMFIVTIRPAEGGLFRVLFEGEHASDGTLVCRSESPTSTVPAGGHYDRTVHTGIKQTGAARESGRTTESTQLSDRKSVV